MNKNNIVKARTCVYNVNYHIVWCTKYRKKILTPEIANELKQLLNEITEEKGFIIQKCEVGNEDRTSKDFTFLQSENVKRHIR